MEKSNTHQFMKASIWTALNSYGFYILNFFCQLFLIRLLFPADYGLYAFFAGIIEICVLFLGFSNAMGFINSAGSQEDFDAAYKLNKIAIALLLCFSLISFFIFLLIKQPMTHALFFVLLCLSQCFLLTAYLYMGPLEKNMQFKKVSIYFGCSSLFSLIVAIVLAKYHFSYWSLGFRDLFNYLFLFLFAYYSCPMRASSTHMKSKHASQLHFNIRLFFSQFMEVIYYRFSDILVRITLGNIILGSFYQARTISYYPIKLTEPLSKKVLFSFFSNIKHDSKSIAHHLNWINYIISRIFLPISTIIIFFGKSIFILLYGQKWALAGFYFECFALWIPLASLCGAAMNTCYSLEKQWVASTGFVTATILFITGMVFFKHMLAPPIFFTIGLLCGYILVLALLRRAHIILEYTRTLILPACLLLIVLFIRIYQHKMLGLAAFLLMYATLLFFEREKIKRLYQKLLELRQ